MTCNPHLSRAARVLAFFLLLLVTTHDSSSVLAKSDSRLARHRELNKRRRRRRRQSVVSWEIGTAVDEAALEALKSKSKKSTRIFNVTWDFLLGENGGGEPQVPTFFALTQHKNDKVRKRVQRRQKKRISKLQGIDIEASFALRTEGVPDIRRDYKLRQIAPESGQVVVALIRNTTSYENFDMEEYLEIRNNALAVLNNYKDKVIGFHVWDIVDDPALDATFAVYASLEAYLDFVLFDDSVREEDRAVFAKLFPYRPFHDLTGAEL